MSADQGAVWIVTIMLRLKNGNSWVGTGFRRMGGHLTFARAADSSTMLKIINRTAEAPPGSTRKSVMQGEAGAGWSATLDDPTAAAVAIGLNTELTTKTVAAGSQVDLADTAPAEGDYWYAAEGHRNITDASVTRANGLLVADGGNAATWTATTALAVGDFIIPTTNASPPAATDHFYEVTVAGTTDATEPSWPVDGTTVIDGTVTLIDRGLVIAAVTTDYRVASAASGQFVRTVGSSLVTGEPTLTSYDFADFTADAYSPGSKYDLRGTVKYEGYNEFDGQKISGYIPNANIFGTTSLDAGSRSVTITGFDVSPQPVDPADPPVGIPADWDYAHETERILKWFE